MISPRKKSRQARSTELVSALLQAANRVLEKEGAQRFTTARVAERAGISVGSLYQYFPNKAAILYRLQSDEWQETANQWRAILADKQKLPLERLRTLVRVFLHSECEEAQVRMALNDAAPLYRDAPELQGGDASDDDMMFDLLGEAVPEIAEPVRRLAADLIEETLTEVGQHFSESSRSFHEIEAYSEAMADMFCAYLSSLKRG